MVARVWVTPENGDKLYIRGDLLVILDVEGVATLYRTVETYVEPSQGIIDKWHNAQKPYHVEPGSGFFRFLEEVETRMIHNDDELEQLFGSVDAL